MKCPKQIPLVVTACAAVITLLTGCGAPPTSGQGIAKSATVTVTATATPTPGPTEGAAAVAITTSSAAAPRADAIPVAPPRTPAPTVGPGATPLPSTPAPTAAPTQAPPACPGDELARESGSTGTSRSLACQVHHASCGHVLYRWQADAPGFGITASNGSGNSGTRKIASGLNAWSDYGVGYTEAASLDSTPQQMLTCSSGTVTTSCTTWWVRVTETP